MSGTTEQTSVPATNGYSPFAPRSGVEILELLPVELDMGAMPVELAWKWKRGASGKASEIVGVALEPQRITILIEPNERGPKP